MGQELFSPPYPEQPVGEPPLSPQGADRRLTATVQIFEIKIKSLLFSLSRLYLSVAHTAQSWHLSVRVLTSIPSSLVPLGSGQRVIRPLRRCFSLPP